MQSLFASISQIGLVALACVFVFGMVIFIHELGHYCAAKFSGITVIEFALGMGPTVLYKVKNGTRYALRLLPIGGAVTMEGEDEESAKPGSFTQAPVGNRILVTVAGAVMNLLLGFVVLVVVTCMEPNIISSQVAEFHEGASTQASGLMVNDTIVAVNGRRCYITNDIMYEFARTQNGTADLTVVRNGKKVELPQVVFETKEENGMKQLVVDFKVYAEEKTLANIIKEAGNTTLSYVRLVVVSLFDLLTGRVAVNQMSGPVGIVTIISQATGYGLQYVLQIMALITVNLGVFNLVPFPALDGGRLMFLLLEVVRKKPINQKFEIIVNAAGFMLLMLLMLFVAFNDVTRLLQ